MKFDNDQSYFGDSDMSDAYGDYAAVLVSKKAAEHHVPVMREASDETLAVLKSLEKNGMVGWKRSHADEVNKAVLLLLVFS